MPETSCRNKGKTICNTSRPQFSPLHPIGFSSPFVFAFSSLTSSRAGGDVFPNKGGYWCTVGMSARQPQ